MNHKRPALLGGAPSFDVPLPFVRPALPSLDAFDEELCGMLDSGHLTKGAHLEAFEQAVAEHLGVRHAVGVSSCTTGLMLTYRGLNLTGEAIVPSFTFMATVSALCWVGVRPVFVDVDFATTNIDAGQIESAITSRTSAIIAVHNFGNPAQIDELEHLARRNGLKLVFDAAHGFGACYRGQPVGAQGDAHVFSLSPTKLLVAGEGGIVATNDDRLARQVRIGREYGNTGAYDSAFAGMNARLPEFNALLGRHGLPLLDGVAQRRNEAAQSYAQALAGLPGLELQRVEAGNRSSYKDFSLAVDYEAFGVSRDQLARCLAAEGIETRKYYSPAVHQQTAYHRYAPHESLLPNTIRLARDSLSLPMGTHLAPSHIERIAEALQRIHASADVLRKHFEVESAANAA